MTAARNGGAERQVGADSVMLDAVIRGPWKAVTNMNVVRYGGKDAPTRSTPGVPQLPGRNFFMGGNNAASGSMRQDIVLSPALRAFARTGRLKAYVAAYLGGWEDQVDFMDVLVEFWGAGPPRVLKQARLAPVTAAERRNRTMFLLRRAAPVGVPAGTASVRVGVRCFWFFGRVCNGYLDNLSVKLQ